MIEMKNINEILNNFEPTTNKLKLTLELANYIVEYLYNKKEFRRFKVNNKTIWDKVKIWRNGTDAIIKLPQEFEYVMSEKDMQLYYGHYNNTYEANKRVYEQVSENIITNWQASHKGAMLKYKMQPIKKNKYRTTKKGKIVKESYRDNSVFYQPKLYERPKPKNFKPKSYLEQVVKEATIIWQEKNIEREV